MVEKNILHFIGSLLVFLISGVSTLAIFGYEVLSRNISYITMRYYTGMSVFGMYSYPCLGKFFLRGCEGVGICGHQKETSSVCAKTFGEYNV